MFLELLINRVACILMLYYNDYMYLIYNETRKNANKKFLHIQAKIIKIPSRLLYSDLVYVEISKDWLLVYKQYLNTCVYITTCGETSMWPVSSLVGTFFRWRSSVRTAA